MTDVGGEVTPGEGHRGGGHVLQGLGDGLREHQRCAGDAEHAERHGDRDRAQRLRGRNGERAE